MPQQRRIEKKLYNLFKRTFRSQNVLYYLATAPAGETKWTTKECDTLIIDINKNNHIRKAVFVFDINKKFIRKYDGVTDAQRDLNINHSIIKKYAKIGGSYKGYIFNYERFSE